MLKKIRFLTLAITIIILIFFALSLYDIRGFIKYEFLKKDHLVLNMYPVNPGIDILTSDPENKFVIKVEVLDPNGIPVPFSRIILNVGNDLGSVYPADVRTNKFGEALITYVPPEHDRGILEESHAKAVINASIYKSSVSAKIEVKLSRAPVVMIHGYQSSGDIFENLMGYLDSKGFETIAFNYDSEKGVAHGSRELEKFLQQKRLDYLAQGVQIKRFDIIAHSMGGLVARYYTCSKEYIKNNDVKKIIFISVPQKGSPIASLGAKYFERQGILDLIPDSELFTEVLPSMINKGLNSTIQTGDIIAQYDEVVSISSATLEAWGISTELFNLGKSNISVDDILNGTLVEAPVHKGILSNTKVFEKIFQMLETRLPYPKVIHGS